MQRDRWRLVPVKLRRQILHRHVELKAVHVCCRCCLLVLFPFVGGGTHARRGVPQQVAVEVVEPAHAGDLARRLCLVGRGFRGRARLAEVPDQILLPL